MTEPTSSYKVITFFGKDLPTKYKHYEAYIEANWLGSLKKYNETFRVMEERKLYDLHYRPFMRSLIYKPGCTIRLAVLTDDPDVILGFSSKREDVLDYVHVRHEQRGHKIASSLIPDHITTFSHVTNMWLPIWQAKYKHWKFNPFA